MSFGWINWINLVAIVCLILINIIVARKELADRFDSKYLTINILEQIGRYACMALMILPIFTKEWKFGFNSVTEMLIWICLTILLLLIYSLLWIKKANGGIGILYGLAIVPVVLFLLNGILLRHHALVIAALVFGISHFIIVKENI
ncbi:MAG: hypothetical protein J1E98_11320 [Lachnospiraceae bacterium]|nr:hypothetical protein [Lachnospiraceae bacterium]